MINKKKITIIYCLILIALALLFVISIATGTVNMSFSDMLFSFIEKDSVNRSIVMDIRMPRALAAIFAGGALAVSGYLLQSFFHNPVAGPYLLGISSGAKLMVALMLVFFSGATFAYTSFMMIVVSFLGAMLSMSFVLLCSKYVGKTSVLLVCGIMIGYICTAICDLVVTFADEKDIVNLHNWSRGSLSGISMQQVLIMGIVIMLVTILVYFLSKPLGAFMISESYAKSLGVNVNVLKVLLVILSSFLSATVTAFAGPISFVGIAVPHLLKSALKSSRPVLMIPACFLGGAVFTCFCDLIARTLFAPTELSISTMTAVFGSPVVIWMLLRRNRE